ncbi:MAG TPA: zinc-dependent peptidase [Candidatus Krumholzibacteria bacterium]|nr:zinc-dependent peptidase [Candidatus Krumholzibacteria bacterium]HPD70876.1 zinc-dependent peptidase [Candidatus Krumholzibacteria bacterium]HRY39424.1 zinc-dependent peptidase [Candidatus Krumholzibacteria bacterium]
MFFLRGRRRQKLLRTPLDEAQRRSLHETAPLCAALPADLRPRHEGVVQVLLAEKHFEGAGGLALTDAMRLTIAGQAALLQLRAHADYYPGLDTVLVYPDTFVVTEPEWDDSGVVHEAPDERAGESWQRGAIVLSWKDVAHESRRRDGYNVVLHEFAHQLDEQDGGADGTPLLPTADLTNRWPEVFQAAFEKHQKALRRRREVLFDADAAESPTEFFATAVEVFFEFPRDLRREFPDVYAVLAEYLELDPAGWGV